MKSRERFLAACRGEEVDRPPVWLMRQAGRYLPEYRQLRERHSFWEMLRRPELAAEATLQPLRRFSLDAAIVFSDILILPAALGLKVEYGEGGPRLGPLVSRPEHLDGLRRVDPRRDLGFLAECLQRLAAELHPDTALIGFAGAPFTLAAYMVEEGPSRGLDGIVGMARREPALYHRLLEMVTEAVIEILRFQADCGADALQLFDTWAGGLQREEYQKLAAPWSARVVDGLRSLGIPLIIYLRESGRLLLDAASSGCGVLSVDDTITLAEARRALGPRPSLQGNLSPRVLRLPAEEIRRQVWSMIDQVGGRGLVVNLSRGLSPEIPPAGVAAMTKAVGDWNP